MALIDPIQPQKQPAPKRSNQRSVNSDRRSAVGYQPRAKSRKLNAGEAQRSRPPKAESRKPEADRRAMYMWIAIGATMAIVLAVWWAAATGPNSVLRKGGSDDLLRRIGQSFGKLFGGTESTTSNANTAQEERLEELRDRVFPQFRNVNDATNAR